MIKKINTLYKAQNEFNRSIMDLNERESLKFFDEFHESILDFYSLKRMGKDIEICKKSSMN